MKLADLAYSDQVTGWTLERMTLSPHLTLLVGISGVGKTRILNALNTVKSIATSDDEDDSSEFWGVNWDVSFTSDAGAHYRWRGAFEPRTKDEADDGDDIPVFFADEQKSRPRVLREQLEAEGLVIIDRNEERILLRGQPTPKLSHFDSAIRVLANEEGVSDAQKAFTQMLSASHTDDTSYRRFFPGIAIERVGKKYRTIDELRSSDHDTRLKLAVTSDRFPDVFREIQRRFQEVFPQVEGIRYVKLRGLEDARMLQIKERGVDRWIIEDRCSSGMIRTLMHLSRMVLWPDGTVILIDEFENSLGVNCIDFVTQDLLDQSRRLQFIITSHHPYIINNIGTEYWKIVSRDGCSVSTRDATALGLESSRHEAFLKLLNLPEYQEGIAAQ